MSDNEFENLELYAKIENSLEELQDCLNDINDINEDMDEDLDIEDEDNF